MLATYTPLATVTVTTDAMAVESRIVREVRRNSDSLRAQHLWDAIRAVRAQKQIPAIPRMARYMTRHHGLSKEATQRLLDLGVEDNLIKLETKIGTKGNKNGIEERAYRLPTHDMLPKERYDWYCFHCHNGGEVVLCIGCHRVYHETCLKEPLSEVNDFFCNFCKIMQKVPEVTINKKERKDLNHLLLLCVAKLEEKMPGKNLMAREPPASARNSFELPERPPKKQKEYEEKMKQQQDEGEGDGEKGDDKKAEPEDDRWRAKFLLKEPMDFEMMEHKCQSSQYRIVEEFRADALLIVHNTVIYHGGHSNMADLARQMFRDCTYDLKEITQCRDCYRFATEKANKNWYCKPCRPYHELVYARQKGFTFWPAKVIRVSNPERPDGGAYDVRFFGGYHQRAVVDKSSIRPITVSVSSLGVKRTSLWNKACDELKKHQEFVAKVKATMPDFASDPNFGDPFTSEEIKEFLTSLVESDNENEEEGDEATKEELEQIKSALEEEDGSKKIMQDKPVAIKSSAPPTEDVSPPKKKRPGRPPKNKHKKAESNPVMTETNSVVEKTGVEENMVSSSSQEPRVASIGIQTPSKLLKDLIAGSSKISKDELRQLKEKIRAEVEADKDQEKKRAVNVATRSLERDLERLKADHATEIEQLTDKSKQDMMELKKKQWCYNCEAEAIYWCCWNTAYCTIECQQEHWHREHKRMCRRKR